MTFKNLLLPAFLAVWGSVPAGAETVIVNTQQNVVNSVNGGGKVNSGVEIGGSRRSKPAATNDGLEEDENTVVVNQKTNVVNKVSGGGQVNSGVKTGDSKGKKSTAVDDELEGEENIAPVAKAKPAAKTGGKITGKTKVNNRDAGVVKNAILAGNGKIETVERSVGKFHGIYLKGAFKVKIVIGAEPVSVKLTGDGNVLEFVRTEVSGGRLDVSASRSFTVANPVQVEIHVPRVNGLWLEGTVDGKVENLGGDQIVCELTGSSRLALAGRVMMLRAMLDGASHLNAAALSSDRVDITASGAAQALVRPSDRLKVTATGAAKVLYYGKTVTVSSKVGGASTVRLVDETEVKDI